jgi:hypothetical protein
VSVGGEESLLSPIWALEVFSLAWGFAKSVTAPLTPQRRDQVHGGPYMTLQPNILA